MSTIGKGIEMGTPIDVRAVLDQRGENYGDYRTMAEIAQRLKTVLRDAEGNCCSRYQTEALELICTKIARIVNGNPDQVDSWTDIAGYAKLVADALVMDAQAKVWLERGGAPEDESEKTAAEYRDMIEREDAFRAVSNPTIIKGV